jgi:membrane-bound lytic murein transglycosylase D
VALQSTSYSPDTVTKVSAGSRQVAYRVRRGDTLFQISRRFQVTVADLRRWNSLEGDVVRAGQRLVIRVDNSRDYGG